MKACSTCGKQLAFLTASGVCVTCQDQADGIVTVRKPRKMYWLPCRACSLVKPRNQFPSYQGLSSARRGICLDCLPGLGYYRKHPELRQQ